MSNIILVGFKAAGKTTLGQKIAKKYQKVWIDTDDLLSCQPQVMYQRLGEKGFRRLEKRHLKGLIGVKQTVIATGGGIVCDEENRKILQRLGTIIHVHTPYDIIGKRLQLAVSSLEFMRDPDLLKKTYEERIPLYQQIANYTVTSEEQLWQVMDLALFFA